ncbi:MAG: hypothetical protein DRI71_07105 [Bacteroidetes bacterium]|nr:MAG: hypothetical protein DRI71_07105 [Bacteroidota bacterium]
MFFTQNNDDFYGSFQNAVSVAFIIFGIVLFFVTDKYLSRNELKKQAVVARIAGLIKVDGLSWGDKEAMLNEEATKMIEVDNELFNRKPI